MRSRALILLFLLLPSAHAATTEWLDVPFVRQVRAGCGAAAIAMVIQYWARFQPSLAGAAADTERIDRMLPASAKGIQGQALKRYLEANGFDAFVFRGERSDLVDQFAKGRPLVVCLGYKGASGWLHYAVVVGIDREAVWLNDSARGKLIREGLDRFETAWKQTDYWSLLAVPRQAR
ncbi:MAG TPA: papain-like cysteine protease family protein [Bryobacteraceae bacterium]|jgi:predicted double-glycine peptidase|nr:papain-like cysteine protease family protein [Bryobacteraceae bacterium]